MADNIKGLKVPEILGERALVQELLLNSGVGRAICIIGNAGIAKTASVEKYKDLGNFDLYFEVKLAGCSSEDLVGIPVKQTNSEGQTVMEFAPLGWMQEIINNPDKKVLLFLDK